MMMRRYVYLGVALGLVLALAGVLFVACYEVPQPACGFRCGALGECPADYACQSDGRCHLNGSAPMVCGVIDASDIDAAPDAPDAGETFFDSPDAPDDAAIDAPIDAAIDAAIDAPTDAPDDAPDDAPPD
jgi:hypothetical protein